MMTKKNFKAIAATIRAMPNVIDRKKQAQLILPTLQAKWSKRAA